MGLAIIVNGAAYSGKGKVTPTKSVPVKAITSITAAETGGNKYLLSATFDPTNTNQTSVRWTFADGSMTIDDVATITQNEDGTGTLQVLPSANNTSVTIKATSTYNSGISLSKAITVTFSASWIVDNRNIKVENVVSGRTLYTDTSIGGNLAGQANPYPLAGKSFNFVRCELSKTGSSEKLSFYEGAGTSAVHLFDIDITSEDRQKGYVQKILDNPITLTGSLYRQYGEFKYLNAGTEILRSDSFSDSIDGNLGVSIGVI